MKNKLKYSEEELLNIVTNYKFSIKKVSNIFLLYFYTYLKRQKIDILVSQKNKKIFKDFNNYWSNMVDTEMNSRDIHHLL